jgi:hypothetical protein
VLLEGQAAGDVEIALAGGVEHDGRGVDSGDEGSSGGELFGEGAIAAAEIEDLFAGLGVEEGDYVGGEGGYEAAVGGVGFGVPGLAGLLIGGGGVHGSIVCLSREVREEDKNFPRVR